VITIDDFLLFSDRTLDGFRRALDRLDDGSINALPDLAGSNSAFQLVTHTLGAVDWWTVHIVLGRPSDRDRPAEFTATGTVHEALAAIDAAQAQLHSLRDDLAEATEIAVEPEPESDIGVEWTVGACLIHAYEEMAQHLGHLELTVDLVG